MVYCHSVFAFISLCSANIFNITPAVLQHLNRSVRTRTALSSLTASFHFALSVFLLCSRPFIRVPSHPRHFFPSYCYSPSQSNNFLLFAFIFNFAFDELRHSKEMLHRHRVCNFAKFSIQCKLGDTISKADQMKAPRQHTYKMQAQKTPVVYNDQTLFRS